jgi:hypothetical protein
MDAQLCTTTLEGILLPFLEERTPGGHGFMQDNDPKHTSRHAQMFYSSQESTVGKLT